MPTWRMKLTPLPRLSRSFSGDRPSRTEGVRRSSDSVNSHCDSARRRSSLGRAGGCGDGEPEVGGIWGSDTACILMISIEPAFVIIRTVGADVTLWGAGVYICCLVVRVQVRTDRIAYRPFSLFEVRGKFTIGKGKGVYLRYRSLPLDIRNRNRNRHRNQIFKSFRLRRIYIAQTSPKIRTRISTICHQAIHHN